jgi:hypothetical protein
LPGGRRRRIRYEPVKLFPIARNNSIKSHQQDRLAGLQTCFIRSYAKTGVEHGNIIIEEQSTGTQSERPSLSTGAME